MLPTHLHTCLSHMFQAGDQGAAKVEKVEGGCHHVLVLLLLLFGQVLDEAGVHVLEGGVACLQVSGAHDVGQSCPQHHACSIHLLTG